MALDGAAQQSYFVLMQKKAPPSSCTRHARTPPAPKDFLVTWPGKAASCFFVDLNSEAFKIDSETGLMQEDDIYPIWGQVEAADLKELSQFIETKSFRKVHVASLTWDTVVVDATWVRKWKRKSDGALVVKSRLCARGL